jgi:hypothetical protein
VKPRDPPRREEEVHGGVDTGQITGVRGRKREDVAGTPPKANWLGDTHNDLRFAAGMLSSVKKGFLLSVTQSGTSPHEKRQAMLDFEASDAAAFDLGKVIQHDDHFLLQVKVILCLLRPGAVLATQLDLALDDRFGQKDRFAVLDR